MIGTAVAMLAVAGPALALQNPIVAQIRAVGSNGAQGNATFFQVGNAVNVGVNLDKDTKGTVAFDLRKGTCKSYASNAQWPLGTFDGMSDQTRLPNTKLQGLVGEVLVIHKTSNQASPVVGCAEIRG